MLVKLQSERLTVRDWRADEVEGRYRIFGNPEVRRFLSFGSDSMKDTARELDSVVKSQSIAHPRPSYFLAVELISSGQTIGNVGFEYRRSSTGDDPDVAEIGYFFEPSSWGHAFRLGAERVIAECDEKNSASENVMKRCGMTPLDSINPRRLLYGIDYNSMECQ
jgi:RimJ/RimL family protein N-acetyltransferase